MTLKKYWLLILIQPIIFSFVKVYFFSSLRMDNLNLQYIFYWLATMVIGIVLIRFLGIINYLEAIWVGIFWSVEDMLVDLVVTSIYTGISIFNLWQFWVGYLVLAVTVFVFHVKRHVALRQGMHVPGEQHH